VANAAAQLDYLVIAPPTDTADTDADTRSGELASIFARIMSAYAELTGHAPEFPAWAGGFWQSKLRYETQDEVLEVAREYKRRELPISVIVIDFFHWTKQGDWSFDPERWPDPAAMIRELHDMGIRVMVSVWPTLNPASENATAMQEQGLLVESDYGNNLFMRFIDTYQTDPVDLQYYDPSNPRARDYIWEQCKANYADLGVDLFWLDACEGPPSTAGHDRMRLHAGSAREIGNAYPVLNARAFYEGMVGDGGEPVLNLSRSAWAGSQRYAAAVWSGDIHSDWNTFRSQIPAGLNIGLSGIPWWTTDIGGFEQGNINDPDFRELVVRWFEFAVFCPLFRLHGNRQPRPYSHRFSGAPNEVWSFGDEAYAQIQELMFLRERLRPYLMEQMAEASRSGVPPMRPLFFHDPEDQEAYSIDDQFYFGPDLVVAPVTIPGARSRSVYVPRQGSWREGWTSEPVEAGSWVECDAPLGRIPVLVRDGAQVKLTP
jgi:alpha-D-xyloside xylohydrolase